MPSLAVYQIYYKESQKDLLDPQFTPFDNAGAVFPYNYEFGVILKSSKLPFKEDELRGFVSWKFRQKTGIDGARFKKFIQDHPGYDVYFINPFPATSFYKSIWAQGDLYHKNLTDFAQQSLTKAGYQINLDKMCTDPNQILFCNFWVGNKRFWDQFMSFSEPLWDYFESPASPVSSEEKRIYAAPADPESQAPYSAYIFERMFSTFLSSPKVAGLRTIHYRYSLAELSAKYNFFVALALWLLFAMNNSWLKHGVRVLLPLIRIFLFFYRGFFKNAHRKKI